jgi:hypothetical protein
MNMFQKMKIVTQEKVIELEAKQERYESEIERPVIVKVNGKVIDLEQTQTIREHGHVVLRYFPLPLEPLSGRPCLTLA